METLIYIFDLAILASILYYSHRNDSTNQTKEEMGPFRIKVQEDKKG